MMKAVVIALIRFYRYFLSPWVGNQCRFTPTCSAYAIEAIEKRGAFVGLILAFKRIGRCNPWSEGGSDPVPDAHGTSSCRCPSDHHRSAPH